MTQDNYNIVSEIAGKHLGQVGGAGYSDQYDPSLLVAIPRQLNRDAYNITEGSLPFTGYDVWNAYEVSALTDKGLPVSGMLKIICPADSTYHVESKSIKLYLNSFNMTIMGNNTLEVVSNIERQVSSDLSSLLQKPITVKMFTSPGSERALLGFRDLSKKIDLDSIEFTSYKSDASTLKIYEKQDFLVKTYVTSDLLRSNCRVTNQPDWGDVYIHMEAYLDPCMESLARYIVSHRKVNHFHEEIVEMMFMHLKEAYNPEKLMVAALYTRRGGIDINPIRATHSSLIPEVFINPNIRLSKTLRQ